MQGVFLRDGGERILWARMDPFAEPLSCRRHDLRRDTKIGSKRDDTKGKRNRYSGYVGSMATSVGYVCD